MRILFYTGKGGVGKTSIAAATGLQCASQGYDTLVMSLDPAHSLADAFDLERSLYDTARGDPVPVADRLWIQEINIQQELSRNWQEVHAYISSLLNVSGLEEVVSEEVAIFPGMEEISCLLHINRYLKEKRFDVMILDCAPTGESVRFVSMPTTLEWYMKKIFRFERNLIRTVRPILKGVTSVPLPEDRYFQNLESLFQKMEGIDRILCDPEVTSVRLVTNPEKMVIKETQRAFMYFALYGLCVDLVIVNRILPEDADLVYFRRWREKQQEYVQEIRGLFAPVPTLEVPAFESEILGKEGLDRLAKRLYDDRNPTDRFVQERPIRFSKEDGRGTVIIRLPFALKGEVDMVTAGDDLVVQVGNFRKHVTLPRTFVGLTPERGILREGELKVEMGGVGDERDKRG
ncbi:MAG TPA: TRC40/GET3/ArsA family transport-energizing ATPase [bacterium]|nr:TRC40/GET3/ArsA family transport-energizing ATPase [bacterium]HQP97469.1 TRC40/GET3/ArsA family transport-energizing ATPase [bacterium]